MSTYKSFLPHKSFINDFPHLLWISPPTHKHFRDSNNYKRAKLAAHLFDVMKTQVNMTTLSMVKIWNQEDSTNYIYESERFTSTGLFNYWASIDSAIRFWNVAILSKIESKHFKSTTRQNQSYNHDKFHWKNSKFHTKIYNQPMGKKPPRPPM